MTRRNMAILVLLALIASGPLACATAEGAPKTTGGALWGAPLADSSQRPPEEARPGSSAASWPAG